MVIHISSVTAGIGRLGIASGESFVFESVSDQEILVRNHQVLVEAAAHILRPIGGRQRNTAVPTTVFHAKEVLVDLVLDDMLHLLHLWRHVRLSTEKGMLWAVIDLSILDRPDCFGSALEASGTESP